MSGRRLLPGKIAGRRQGPFDTDRQFVVAPQHGADQPAFLPMEKQRRSAVAQDQVSVRRRVPLLQVRQLLLLQQCNRAARILVNQADQ